MQFSKYFSFNILILLSVFVAFHSVNNSVFVVYRGFLYAIFNALYCVALKRFLFVSLIKGNTIELYSIIDLINEK
jgi:hypothetical protein